jgi:hypothetical protein
MPRIFTGIQAVEATAVGHDDIFADQMDNGSDAAKFGTDTTFHTGGSVYD